MPDADVRLLVQALEGVEVLQLLRLERLSS